MTWIRQNLESADLAAPINSLENLDNLRGINRQLQVMGATTEILFGQGENALRCKLTNEG